MKTGRNLILLLLALHCAGSSLSAQELVAGADFATRFDNREYSGNAFSPSETFFSARLTPEFGVQWDGRNRLMIAVDLWQDFGDGSKFLTDAKPQIYYTFSAPRVTASAGIFPRTQLLGSYSEAFFSSDVVFYDNLISGVLANYHSPRGYVEFALDWEGMRTTKTREKFRILSAGEYRGARLYGGYAFSMLHYAKSANETPDEGVVDYFLVNPYAGVRFHAFFDFDLRLGYLQSVQRDRRIDQSWSPKGGEFLFSMSRWGLSLRNHLYLGQNLMPMWGTYGSTVYTGSPFYGTTKHVYNKTSIDYERLFFHDTLGIKAGFVFHYDGVGVGVQQLLTVSVKLEKIVYKARK